MSVLNGLKLVACVMPPSAAMVPGVTADVGSTDGAVTLKLLVYFAIPL